MKAVVIIRTWKNAKNPDKWNKFAIDKEERFLFEANNIDEAELKVLTSFPAYKCIGYNIQLENKDFCCSAVKDYWHYDDNTESIQIFGTDHPTDRQIVDFLTKCTKERIERRNYN